MHKNLVLFLAWRLTVTFHYFTLQGCVLRISSVDFWTPQEFLKHFKKSSWKKTNIFWSKIDFEILIEKFSEKTQIFENWDFRQKFWKSWKSENFQNSQNFENFRWKSWFSKISRIFGKFSGEILKSIFEQKFSIFLSDLFFKPL